MANAKPTFMVPDPSAPYTRNEDLEQKIRQKPDDASVHLVYADWLIGHGDPRGELATVQHQLTQPEGPRHVALREREQEILDANGGFLGGVSAEVASAEWHLGTWKRLRIHNEADWMDASFDARAVARRLFDLPPASGLPDLALGLLRWEYQSQDVPVVLEEAASSAFATTLRRLRIGDVAGTDVDNAHHSIGDIGIVSRAFPRLQRLSVWGYEIAIGANLDLPELEELEIQTCALTRDVFDRVIRGNLPKLRKLELWFGSEDYGCQLGAGDLLPILDGSTLPTVTSLGLCNAEFTDAMVAELVESKVLARLETLDLSKGVLSNDGARVLLNHADRWKHLRILNVNENYLTDEVIEELRRVGPEILDEDQKDDEDLDYRYVSVSE